MTILDNYYSSPYAIFTDAKTVNSRQQRCRFSRLQLHNSVFNSTQQTVGSRPVRSHVSPYLCRAMASNIDDDDNENAESVCSVETVESSSSPGVKIVALVGEGSVSKIKSMPWSEIMLHTAKRLKWVDEGYEMLVFTDNLCQGDNETTKRLRNATNHADIVMIVAVQNQESVEWIKSNTKDTPNIICFESSPSLPNKLGGSIIKPEKNATIFDNKLPFLQPKTSKETEENLNSVYEAWNRQNSDDIRFCLLVIINAYIRPVPSLQNLRAKGFSTLTCMIKNCGPQILNCLLDPNCRKALQCLNSCSAVDQVCSYRCIASYESPQLEAFSLCVLQKNNCLELDAKIPDKPHVAPMVRFRGEPLDHETAEDLFVGWLGRSNWSWRVVSGQNPAYDQFPCQYQLFYRGKAKGSFWYEPVFQVKTLDGELVWRRRKYRVKRGKAPGTFSFSVLDNGVVSNESWTIVDVSDDLGWGLFHYHGAARVAGQSYTGAVLVSRDGEFPDKSGYGLRLGRALERCCVKEWELFDVDNSCCKNPPLGLPEGSRLHHRIDVDYLSAI